MEPICLEGARKSGSLNRTLYRVAAVGIATLITQAAPGGAVSSWGVECLTTNLGSHSYCVTSLEDDNPTESSVWNLRKSVEDANTRAAASATIGFSGTLFIDQGVPKPGKIILNSTLEIKTDITISGPGSPLLTIERGVAIETGTPLIAINPGGVGKATGEVKIEGIKIDSNANPTTGGLASGVKANPGVAIQVSAIEVSGDGTTTFETPTVVIKSGSIINAVSETGGAAINTPGDVQIENSDLSGNMVVTPHDGAASDGGAIKSEGTVTVIGSGLYNNSATGNGGAISAKKVEVTTDSSVYAISQVSHNVSGGDGGAISAQSVSVSNGTILEDNVAGGDGGAISAEGSVIVDTAALQSNSAGMIGNTSPPPGGNGGAISAGSVTVRASVFSNNSSEGGFGFFSSGGHGGAISADGPVEVNDSIFQGNYSSSDGGAIHSHGDISVTSNFDKSNQITTPGINEVIKQSTFSGNFAEGLGGAISAVGPGSTVSIDNSVFEGNFSLIAGGAIFHVGSLEVANKSEFSGNIASESAVQIAVAREACAQELAGAKLICAGDFLNQWDPHPTFGGGPFNFTGGGAIYGLNLEILLSSMNGSEEVVTSSPTSSIQDSLFKQNSAQGDGGAIFYLGLLQILGSRFEENLSLLAPIQAGYGNPTVDLRGFGGAVYGLSVELTASNFEGNLAALGGGAIYAEENVDIFGEESQTSSSKSNQFLNNVAMGKTFDGDDIGGNGGAISAVGSISIADSNFQGNFASTNGGAIYSLMGVDIRNSVFGSTPEVNKNFNPIVGMINNPLYDPRPDIPNPDFNPMLEIPNPDFNPIIEVLNPNYDISVTREIVNPDYNINVPRLLRNPECPSDSWFYEGVDFGNGILYLCEFWRDTSYYQINHVINPLYDDREFIDNPKFDDRIQILELLRPELPQNELEFISELAHPERPFDDRGYIVNPFFDNGEFLPLLSFPTKPENNYKYIYLGNQSRSKGGAIYVEGVANIEGTQFLGNSSSRQGGAIYSKGALTIEDSEFNRNWSNANGGAIRTKPGDAFLSITRTSFVENLSTFNGGAISIRTVAATHSDDFIIASLFRGNEAFVSGGAINSSYANLILNTFEDNIAPEGQALYLDGGALFGNFIMGDSTVPSLCAGGVISGSYNFATDSSCFEVQENSNLSNSVLTRSVKMDLAQELSLPQEFETELLSRFGDSLPGEYGRDFNGDVRDVSVLWTAGHLQRIFPTPIVVPPVTPEVVTPPMIEKGRDTPEAPQPNLGQGNVGINNQVVAPPSSSPSLSTFVLALEPGLSEDELSRNAQLQAEHLAKIEAAKLAKERARALATERRRTQLAALAAKIAATKARGETLKQKSSWINLMKDFKRL